MPDIVSRALPKSRRKAGRAFKRTALISRMEWSLFDAQGRRKYLTPAEREAFLMAALAARGEVATFCAVLILTGARLSEVLKLTPQRIDDGNCAINFVTLKQKGKRRLITRAVPISPELLNYLESTHHYRDALNDPRGCGAPLWTWSRTTAWRRLKKVMRLASNPEHLCMSRAVRHAFGAAATVNDVSLAMTQKWLGHTDIRTTAIYSTITGNEERILARRMWADLAKRLEMPSNSGV
jgi:integrase/recombinase XerD